MLKNFSLSIFIFCCLFSPKAFAQDAPKEGWDVGLGTGLDFLQALLINPRVGAGDSRLGIGGAANLFAKYKKGHLAWDNTASLQYGVVRIGTGFTVVNPTKKVPFQKSLDVLRFDSKLGYKPNADAKWFYATDFSFLSQVSSSYDGNYTSDFLGTGVKAKFLSPAQIVLSVGIDWKPQDNLSIYFSPVAYKAIIVSDDNIAKLSPNATASKGIHGNPWRSATDFDNVFNQFGALLKAKYTKKFLNDKMSLQSGLALYNNYLENFGNIDVDWNNSVDFNIYKGLSLNLGLGFWYDHDVLVRITDFDAPNGESGLGRRLSTTEQILVKYNIVF